MVPVCQFGRPADLTGSPAAGRAGQPGETSLLTRPQVFLACLASLIVVHCACMMFGFLAGKQNTLQIFQWQPSSATCHILMFMSSDAAIRYPCACRPRKAPANQELCSHPTAVQSWPVIRSYCRCTTGSSPCPSALQVCLATNPIWVIKTRLQLQRRATAAAAAASTGAQAAAAQKAAALPAYRGLVDAARQIARQEGLLGFYKGLVPSLLLVGQNSSYCAACVATTSRACLPGPCWDIAGQRVQAELARKATSLQP